MSAEKVKKGLTRFDNMKSGGGIDLPRRFLIKYALVHPNGEIAQLVERRTHKPKVKGSIPFLATI